MVHVLKVLQTFFVQLQPVRELRMSKPPNSHRLTSALDRLRGPLLKEVTELQDILWPPAGFAACRARLELIDLTTTTIASKLDSYQDPHGPSISGLWIALVPDMFRPIQMEHHKSYRVTQTGRGWKRVESL